MESFRPTPDRPSLAGAKQRSQRAAQHLQELEAIIREFERQNPNPLVVTADRGALLEGNMGEGLRIDWSESKLPSSTRLGIVAGEALYNLRAALDYLIFALAWLDSGSQQDNTQFPIADSPASWTKQAKSRLKGVKVKHRAMIEKHQPFRGCEWPETLRTLSNPDKHRTLTAVFSQFEGSFQVQRDKAEPVPNDPVRVRLPVTGQAARIYFWNNMPVFETLRELTVRVARVLAEFQADFGESDVLTIHGEAG
jgi:hypothetical protein